MSEQRVIGESASASIEHGEEADQNRIEADARLIAAAPELLEVLKSIAENDPGSRPRDWLATARAVIAKAEGRS